MSLFSQWREECFTCCRTAGTSALVLVGILVKKSVVMLLMRQGTRRLLALPSILASLWPGQTSVWCEPTQPKLGTSGAQMWTAALGGCFLQAWELRHVAALGLPGWSDRTQQQWVFFHSLKAFRSLDHSQGHRCCTAPSDGPFLFLGPHSTTDSAPFWWLTAAEGSPWQQQPSWFCAAQPQWKLRDSGSVPLRRALVWGRAISLREGGGF